MIINEFPGHYFIKYDNNKASAKDGATRRICKDCELIIYLGGKQWHVSLLNNDFGYFLEYFINHKEELTCEFVKMHCVLS